LQCTVVLTADMCLHCEFMVVDLQFIIYSYQSLYCIIV